MSIAEFLSAQLAAVVHTAFPTYGTGSIDKGCLLSLIVYSTVIFTIAADVQSNSHHIKNITPDRCRMEALAIFKLVKIDV